MVCIEEGKDGGHRDLIQASECSHSALPHAADEDFSSSPLIFQKVSSILASPLHMRSLDSVGLEQVELYRSYPGVMFPLIKADGGS